MSSEIIKSNTTNILFLGLLILALMFHLFLGELLIKFLTIESLTVMLGIGIILITLHLTIGRKLFHHGGLLQ